MQTNTSKRLTAKAGTIAATVVGVVALLASPAAADNSDELVHGLDVGNVTAYDSGRYTIEVFDYECDSHQAVVDYVNYGSTVVHTLKDPDGCFGDSGHRSQLHTRIASWRLCERGGGCTDWVSGPRP
jgi:hypothetical protein